MTILNNITTVIDLSEERFENLAIGRTSKGNQTKYYDTVSHSYVKLPFYYQDMLWKDYMVEFLSYLLSTMLHIPKFHVLKQTIVRTVNPDGFACISPDFDINKERTFLPFNRMRKLAGENTPKELQPDTEFNRLLRVYKKVCDIDATEYLITMFIMDYLVLNEDRHYNNFGIDVQDGEYTFPVLFDFGLGLFEHDKMYKNLSLDKAIKKCTLKPISKNPDAMLSFLVRAGYSDYIRNMVKNLKIPSLMYFPSELGYAWYCHAYEKVKEI